MIFLNMYGMAGMAEAEFCGTYSYGKIVHTSLYLVIGLMSNMSNMLSILDMQDK